MTLINMNTSKYISIDRIFAKLSRDLPIDSINESDIIEWSGEALEAIGAVTLYEEAVAFVEVKNHQVGLPSRLHQIIQVARNNSYSPKFCPKNIVKDIIPIENNLTCGCAEIESCGECKKADYTLLDCDGKPITGYDIAYYRPYFDLQYEYTGWSNSHSYQRHFTPIRLTNNTMFNSLVSCYQDNTIYNSSSDEYSIIKGNILRFSFQEGSVAISYLRQVVDNETGYPMIPDHYSYITAITKYVTYRIMERDFYAGRDGSQSRLQKAEADWHWYCKQAGNLALMPKGVDQWQNILEQRHQLLPNMRRYYSFFGDMSKSGLQSKNNKSSPNNIQNNANCNTCKKSSCSCDNTTVINNNTDIFTDVEWDSNEW